MSKLAGTTRQPHRAAKAKARRGLLGFAVAGSSEDEDYEVEVDQRPSRGTWRGGRTGGNQSGGRGTQRRRTQSSQLRERQQQARRSAENHELDNNSEEGGGGSSSSGGSAETLRQRMARIARAPRAPGGAGLSGALPLNVLSHIFQLACARGALPTACRLARVCRVWRDAVAAAPEVWRVMDARGRRNAKIDKWLQRQAASGRWREVEELSVGQAPLRRPPGAGGEFGGDAGSDGEDDWEAEDSSDQPRSVRDSGTSGEALAALVAHCGALRKLTVSGRPSMRAAVLESALLSASRLSELRLRGVQLQPVSGLDRAVQALLAAAWGGGRPLRVLVARRCPQLTQKTLWMLCCGPGKGAGAGTAHQQQLEQGQHQGQGPVGQDSQGKELGPGTSAGDTSAQTLPSAAVSGSRGSPKAYGYPDLAELDLTGSCIATRLMISFEELKRSCPNLEVLSVEGVGALYGWAVARPRDIPGPAAAAAAGGGLPFGGLSSAGGWPRLRVLRIGSLQQRSQSGGAGFGRSVVDDALLMRLASGSPLLAELGVSGCTAVTPGGLRALIKSLEELRASGGPGRAVHGELPGRACEEPSRLLGAADGELGGAAAAAAVAVGDRSGPGLGAPPCGLARLDVTRSGLCCDEGLAAMGDLLSATLRSLAARGGGGAVTDAGLAALHGCGRLEALDVGGSSITDDGLRDLLGSPAGRSLAFIDVSICRSLGRATRQAALEGIASLRRHLAEAGAGGYEAADSQNDGADERAAQL